MGKSENKILSFANVSQSLLVLLLLTPLAGVFGRFSYGNIPLTLTDIFLVTTLFTWGVSRRENIFTAEFFISRKNWILPLGLFLGIAFLSLLKNTVYFSARDFGEAFLYFGRFTALAVLILLGSDLGANRDQKFLKIIISTTLSCALGLAILGFLQVVFFPDFKELGMETWGWDPHQGRLLSTWFDPNLLGGFFVFVLGLTLGLYFEEKTTRKKYYTFVLVLLGIALALTFSRSSIVALVVMLLGLSFRVSWRIFFWGVVFVFVALLISPRLQERIEAGILSLGSILPGQHDLFLPDATARLRQETAANAFTLFQEKPFLGHGFNTLRTLQVERGFLLESEHSVGGFDTSLLTILVTTGLFGVTTFLWFWFEVLRTSFSQKNTLPELQGLRAGFFAGFLGLFVHAFFVNSLLFPWILLFIFPLSGIILAAGQNYPAPKTEKY